MLPSGVRVKVGSDLDGLTTVRYKFEGGPRGPALLAPACNQIRDHVLALGPMN